MAPKVLSDIQLIQKKLFVNVDTHLQMRTAFESSQ